MSGLEMQGISIYKPSIAYLRVNCKNVIAVYDPRIVKYSELDHMAETHSQARASSPLLLKYMYVSPRWFV